MSTTHNPAIENIARLHGATHVRHHAGLVWYGIEINGNMCVVAKDGGDGEDDKLYVTLPSSGYPDPKDWTPLP